MRTEAQCGRACWPASQPPPRLSLASATLAFSFCGSSPFLQPQGLQTCYQDTENVHQPPGSSSLPLLVQTPHSSPSPWRPQHLSLDCAFPGISCRWDRIVVSLWGLTSHTRNDASETQGPASAVRAVFLLSGIPMWLFDRSLTAWLHLSFSLSSRLMSNAFLDLSLASHIKRPNGALLSMPKPQRAQVSSFQESLPPAPEPFLFFPSHIQPRATFPNIAIWLPPLPDHLCSSSVLDNNSPQV